MSSYRSVAPVIEIYRAKSIGAALYGAELWGQNKKRGRGYCKNCFHDSGFGTPPVCPLTPMCMDLGLKNVAHVAAFRPLAYWIRVWSNNSPFPLRQSVLDVIAIDTKGSISWLKYVKSWIYRLGMSELWTNSTYIQKKSLINLKKRYCHYINESWLNRGTVGELTRRFLNFKDSMYQEEFLNRIKPPLAKSRFLKFGYHILPVNGFCSK